MTHLESGPSIPVLTGHDPQLVELIKEKISQAPRDALLNALAHIQFARPAKDRIEKPGDFSSYPFSMIGDNIAIRMTDKGHRDPTDPRYLIYNVFDIREGDKILRLLGDNAEELIEFTSALLARGFYHSAQAERARLQGVHENLPAIIETCDYEFPLQKVSPTGEETKYIGVIHGITFEASRVQALILGSLRESFSAFSVGTVMNRPTYGKHDTVREEPSLRCCFDSEEIRQRYDQDMARALYEAAEKAYLGRNR